MSIRKFTAALLAAVLVLTLAGCSLMKKTGTPDSDRERLVAILNDISENMRPATAGSSLVSIRLAADLISWAATTSMDKQEAAGIVLDWLKEQTPEIQAAFREKMQHVSDSFGSILKDGAAGLLESAGVEKDFSNLSTRLQETVKAILASGGVG